MNKRLFQFSIKKSLSRTNDCAIYVVKLFRQNNKLIGSAKMDSSARESSLKKVLVETRINNIKLKSQSNNSPTTIKSIADKLGISPSTVSRVLNNMGEKFRISTKTINLVKETAAQLNYTPNQIAKSLRLQRTFTLGLIVSDISNPWFAKIARKVEKSARIHGYDVFICNSDEEVGIEKKSIELLKNRQVDGIVIAPIGLEHQHLLDSHENGMPMVLIDRFFDGIDIPYVATDDFTGAYEANQYLIRNGHSKIACIQGLIGTSTNTQRIKGYREALDHNNIEVNPSFITGYDFGFQNGYDQGLKIINHLDDSKITAVFSTSNQISLGLLKVFKEKNIRVPEDISIVSFDDQDYSELLYTPLSTVAHTDEKMGEIALELLFQQIENNDKTLPIVPLLPTHFIQRASVKNRFLS